MTPPHTKQRWAIPPKPDYTSTVMPQDRAMINLQNKKRSAYERDGDLPNLQAVLNEYWDESRVSETKSINDLEKYLWLANGAAATACIGFIQAKETVSLLQYAGVWSFVSGLLLLLIMKYVSAANSSRDRYRFQEAKSRFDGDQCTDHVFRTVRDRTFGILRCTYLILQYGAGVAFVIGCICTLAGVRCSS